MWDIRIRGVSIESFFQIWIDLWIEPTHIIKTNSIMAKLKRKIITWSNFEWKKFPPPDNFTSFFM